MSSPIRGEPNPLPTIKRPLTWQKLRAMLVPSGLLDTGWRIGHKADEKFVARVYHAEGSVTASDRNEMKKALDALGVKYTLEGDSVIRVGRQNVKNQAA